MKDWVDLVSLVIYWGGIATRRWSPISLLTGLNVCDEWCFCSSATPGHQYVKWKVQSCWFVDKIWWIMVNIMHADGSGFVMAACTPMSCQFWLSSHLCRLLRVGSRTLHQNLCQLNHHHCKLHNSYSSLMRLLCCHLSVSLNNDYVDNLDSTVVFHVITIFCVDFLGFMLI